MSTKFGTALVKGEDSFKVGKEAAVQAMQKAGIEKADFSIVFCSSKYDYKEVVRGVREATKGTPLIGCSTAGEFNEEKVGKESVVCAVISTDKHLFFNSMGKNLRKDEMLALQEAAGSFPPFQQNYPYLSAIMLIDGLAGKGEESVLAALGALGPNVKFSGAAAADDFKALGTYVFSNDEVATDAVSLAFIASATPVAIGVKHGHSPISPPLTVTKSEGNIVYELNGRSALEVWKEYTRQNAKDNGIDVDNIKDTKQLQTYLTRYEAGLMTGEEYKIRWPGGTVSMEGPLTFACSMNEGVVLRVMESPQQAQIISAKKAALAALKSCRNIKLAGAIVFDCVCRAVILGDQFSQAVEGIKEVLGGIPIIGFETYGEIAMEIGQLSGFHNTTTVVMLIPE